MNAIDASPADWLLRRQPDVRSAEYDPDTPNRLIVVTGSGLPLVFGVRYATTFQGANSNAG